MITADDIKLVSLDGVLTHKFRCPNCRQWAYLDDDQFFGRVSLQCASEGCDFHKTIDLSTVREMPEERDARDV